MKSNYGVPGGKIDLEWKNGLFVPVQGPSGLDKMAADAKADEVFLAILKRFNAQGRNAGVRPGTSYAPALFAGQPDNQGIGKKQFEAAMNRLLADKKVAIAESGPPSRRVQTLVLSTGAPADVSSAGLFRPICDQPSTGLQPCFNRPSHTPPYTPPPPPPPGGRRPARRS